MTITNDSPQWQLGRAGERLIRAWLQQQGFLVVPTADIAGAGAPMLEGLRFRAVLPDFMAAVRGHSRWVEVKTKSHPTLYRKTGVWEHGLPLRQWLDYIACEEQTGIPGWLCIYERERVIVLMAPLRHLEARRRIYRGGAMPDGEDHVFFPCDAFTVYDGPRAVAMPGIEPLAERTLTQPPAPSAWQPGLEL